MKKVLERHEETIRALAEFIKGKMNVHGEIRKYVAALGSSFARVVGVVGELKKSDPPTSIVETQTSPSLMRTYAETTAKNIEVVDVNTTTSPKIKRAFKVKRKERTSPEEPKREAKIRKKEATMATVETVATVNLKKAAPDWTEVKKRKNCKKKKVARERPNAIIIRPKEREQFAEVLKKVKQNPAANEISKCVDKIRRTAAGDMLLILTKNDTDKTAQLKITMAELLGEEATVVTKVQEVELEIKDLEEIVTKQEILEAIQKTTGEGNEVTIDAIKSMRKAYGGTITATVKLQANVAKKILDHGKIKIGWVNCRIKSVQKPTKCFRCWRYGHLAHNCKEKVDKTKLCMKCGEPGHKVADCQKEAKCVLCLEDGNIEDCAHIAGSGRCVVFRKALQVVRKPKHA